MGGREWPLLEPTLLSSLSWLPDYPGRALAFRCTSYPLSVNPCGLPGWPQYCCTAHVTRPHIGFYLLSLFSACGETQGLLSTKCSITDLYLELIKKEEEEEESSFSSVPTAHFVLLFCF